MFRIKISSLKESENKIELEATTDELEYIAEEFFGSVKFSGMIRKIKNRYTIMGKVSAKANLICDLTTEEFSEEINADVKINFIQDSMLFESIDETEKESVDHILLDDNQYIDFTDEICQLLLISIPMKRIAPEHRGKDFTDIYPELAFSESQDAIKIDERWNALKDISFN